MADLEDAQEELQDEWHNWEISHLPHPKDIFEIDKFHLVCKLDALIKILIDKDIFDEDEYLTYLTRQMTEQMIEARPQLIKARLEAKRMVVQQRIIGPNGEFLS